MDLLSRILVVNAFFPLTKMMCLMCFMLLKHMVSISQQWVDQGELLKFDKIRYNTSNIWKNDEPPDDYLEIIMQTTTSTWIDKFHKDSYHTIELDLCTPLTYWIKNAERVGATTGKFPQSFKNERDKLAGEIEGQYPEIFNGTDYFIRTEIVSLKCGQHKAGPYRHMTEILESLVTCVDGHSPIRKRTTGITIYFIHWVVMNPFKEYRGFVFEGNLTALSQQNIYSSYEPFNEHFHITNATIIYHYFHTNMQLVLGDTRTYTFDIAILESSLPYFIETNCFGGEYAAGSSLFGWAEDHAILYGNGNNIVVRATN